MENKASVLSKDYNISVIRMIATIMVVMLHIFQQSEKLCGWLHIVTDWFNIGLVMFFCISGFLYAKNYEKKGIKWFYNRYVSLIVPSVFVGIVTITVYLLFIGNLSLNTVIFSVISCLGGEAFVSDGWMFVQLWFLTYILVCYATIPLLNKIDFRNMHFALFWGGVLVSCMVFQGVGYLLSHFLSFPSLSWGVLLRFYLTYVLFRRYSGDGLKKVMIVISILAFIALIVTIFVRYIFAYNNSFSELLFVYSQTIIGICVFYWLYMLLNKHKTERKKLLDISDRFSYSVYLTHCLFIGYNTSLLFAFNNIWLGILVALVLTCLASFLVTTVSNPIIKKLRIHNSVKKGEA